jgi:hypothetical protein
MQTCLLGLVLLVAHAVVFADDGEGSVVVAHHPMDMLTEVFFSFFKTHFN